MSIGQSVRHGFPFLEAGQAQKELLHNEALALIDIATNGAVLSADLSAPPSAPAEGACWIVGAGAIGAWAGREGAIAGWTGSGWRFAGPVDGMRVRIADRQLWAEYVEGAWTIGVVEAETLRIAGNQVVGPRGAVIADPAGGGTIDAEVRFAVVSILSRLRAHGLIESE